MAYARSADANIQAGETVVIDLVGNWLVDDRINYRGNRMRLFKDAEYIVSSGKYCAAVLDAQLIKFGPVAEDIINEQKEVKV